MGDENSWCTCTKAYPSGWNTDGCPVHDRMSAADSTTDSLNEWFFNELVDLAIWLSNTWEEGNEDDREEAEAAVTTFLKGRPQ